MRLSLFLALLATSCGSAAHPEQEEPFGTTPLTHATALSGLYSADVYSAPQPPVRGKNRFRFELSLADGGTFTGQTLAVKPFMPAMGHGSAVTPDVTRVSDSVFEASPVYLPMAGTWELRVSVDGVEQLVPTVDVP